METCLWISSSSYQFLSKKGASAVADRSVECDSWVLRAPIQFEKSYFWTNTRCVWLWLTMHRGVTLSYSNPEQTQHVSRGSVVSAYTGKFSEAWGPNLGDRESQRHCLFSVCCVSYRFNSSCFWEVSLHKARSSNSLKKSWRPPEWLVVKPVQKILAGTLLV